MRNLILTLILCVFTFTCFALGLPENVKDVNSYSKYLSKNFKWVAEPKWKWGEHWQTPEETIQLGKGDCEDFATLTYTVLKQLGYEPNIYILVGDINHAVLTFKRKSNYVTLFSNTTAWYSRYTDDVKLLISYFRPKEIHKLIKIKYGRHIAFNLKTQAVKVWEEKK